MTWHDIGAERPNDAKTAPVTMCASAGTGVQRRRVTITFRDPEILALPWVKKGRMVKVMIGRGEHDGRLRIVAGAGAKLFSIGQKATQEKQICLRSATLAAALPLRPGEIAPVSCGYDWHNDWIEIDLPKWALPQSAQGAPRLSDLSVPATKAPVKREPSVLDGVPVPISRAAGGPVR